LARKRGSLEGVRERGFERNGKDPSRASTKEMTVKLEKVLAV